MPTGSMRPVAFAFLVLTFQVVNVHGQTDEQWKAGLIMAGRQRLLIEKMSFEFLAVAKSINKDANKLALSESISDFMAEHTILKDGDASVDVPASPSTDITSALSALNTLFAAFKGLLESNVNSPSISNTLIDTLNDRNLALIEAADEVARIYMDAAMGAGAAFSGLQVNTASKQGMIAPKMALEVFLQYSGIDPDSMLGRIESTSKLFGEAHDGLLEGLEFVGLDATDDKCILQQMRSVTYLWDDFKYVIDGVIFNRVATNTDLQNIADKMPTFLNQTQEATIVYATPPSVCPVSISDDGWKLALDIHTQMLMYAQKSGRLFLQAAKGVNTLDSRVLFSNAEVSTRSELKLLREGSQARDLPAPVTQAVSDSYSKMQTEWSRLGTILEENIQTVSNTDVRLLQLLEDESKEFVTEGNTALEALEAACTSAAPSVPCVVLKTIGRQRWLIQKSAYEAVLIGLERNVVGNQAELDATITLFEESHATLIHGLPPNIPRTSNICTLSQMKKVDDLWTPFKEKLVQVKNGDGSVGTLLSIWGMTWNAGVDPMYAQITTAMEEYAGAAASCTLTATRDELQAALKNLGVVRGNTQKLAAYFFLVSKGLDAAENRETLTALTAEFKQKLLRLVSGYTLQKIPVPLEQNVADRLFAVADDFAVLEPLLAGNGGTEPVVSGAQDILTSTQSAMTVYVDAAWDVDTEVPGARSDLASSLLMLTWKMCKDAVLVGLGKSSMRPELSSSLNTFKSSQQTLVNGNSGEGKDLIKATDPDAEAEHIAKMSTVSTAFNDFEPRIKEIADGGDASNSALRRIMTSADSLEGSLLSALNLYSTKTETTTKIAVDVLVPLPMTGTYAPGATMRTATLVAADIINEQETVLPPDYALKVTFLNSECDPDRAVTQVLGEFANSDEWTAVGGMACSRVCESMAVVVSSVFIPNLGFDCTSDTLSDTNRFPGFVRLGVRTTLAKDVILTWSNMFKWDHIAIVSGDPVLYRDDAGTFVDAFTAGGIESSYSSSLESDWATIVTIMRNLNGNKRRVIMLLGDETFFRKVVCAAHTIDARPGLTWISVGARQQAWWTLDDPEVMAISTACAGNKTQDLVQGALSITGLGVAEDKDKSTELSCFKGHTSESMLTLIEKSLRDGYPAGSNVVTSPHETLMGAGADGICVLAKTLGNMLYKGYSIDQLRQYGQNGAVYAEMTAYIRDTLQFAGVSGPVDFVENDKPGRLGLFQIRGTESVPVGTVSVDGVIRTGVSYGLQNSSWQPAYPDPPGKLEKQWKKGLTTAGRQRLLLEKMTVEFLMVAQGIDVNQAKAAMVADIATFEAEHQALKAGSADGDIPAPTVDIVNALQGVLDLWSPFKTFLQNHIDLPTIDNNALSSLDQMNLPLINAAEAAASLYVDAANAAGADFSGLQVNTVSRQGMLALKMVVEALFLHAGVTPVVMLNRLEATSRLFSEAHAGILEGLNFVGLTATIDKCILQQMRAVTFLWDEFKYVTDGIIFNEAASTEAIQQVTAKFPSLLVEQETATDTYATPPSSCPVAVADSGWASVIDMSTRQLMYAQKAARLFLQAAKGVNTLDSIVLFSDSRVSALNDLRLLREGSQELDLPAPVTQPVSEQYGSMFAEWQRLGSILADNIGTVTDKETRMLQLTEDDIKLFGIAGLNALDGVVNECKAKAASVQCVVLQVLGRQRYLIQKSATEAVLIALERTVEQNKVELSSSIDLFEGSHYDLIHGKQPDIPRTTGICTLQEMKKVDDLWLPFKALLDQVYNGDHSIATLLTIWGMTWNAGVDPIFAQLSKATEFYVTGTSTCEVSATRPELESAIKEVGILREYTQKMPRYFLLIAKGLDAQANTVKLNTLIAGFAKLLSQTISGYSPKKLPVPIMQPLANQLYAVATEWAAYEPLLEAGTNADSVEAGTLRILAVMEDAMLNYVDAAWAVNKDVPGARSNLASSLLMQVQKMIKDAVMVGLGKESKRSAIASGIEQFKGSKQTLLEGNGELGKTAIKTTDPEAEEELIIRMNRVQAAFEEFEPKLKEIASGGIASDGALKEIGNKGDQLENELLGALDLYSTMTQTTTKIAVDILVPLPITGTYNPGDTMRTATMVAMDIINEQETVLPPDYELKITFLDSECDPDRAVTQVLGEFANSDEWTALGGMACSRVCESMAVVVSSVFIPNMGFDCAADSLSDTNRFPGFVRLGVRTTQAKDVITTWSALNQWEHLAVVSGNPILYRDDAEKFISAFTGAGIDSSYDSSLETDWTNIVAIMRNLNGLKHRVIMVLGDETFFRKLVCAANEVNARPGLVWISVGSKRKAWWTADDPVVIAHSAACTGAKISELVQGALSIVGLGSPAEADRNTELTCFQGHTSDSMLALIEKSLKEGYPAGSNIVTDPHVELMGAGADGLCVLAKTLGHMLYKGYHIDQLRQYGQNGAVYIEMTEYIREQLAFNGVSGVVNFVNNDKPGRLGLFQISGSASVPVGTVSVDGVIQTGYDHGLKTDSWLPAYPDPPGKLEKQWKKGLMIAGRQRLLLQNMTFELLMIAAGMKVAESKTSMADDIATFEKEHQDLKDGSADGEIPAATTDIIDALKVVNDLWSPFKAFLQAAADSPKISNLTLMSLNQKNVDLIEAAETVASLYVDAGNAAGADFSGLQVNTASRQGMLVPKMSVEAFLFFFGIDKDNMLIRLDSTSKLFAEALAGILEGLNFVGLTATVDKCILQHMRKVTFLWDKLQYTMAGVIFNEVATEADLASIGNEMPGLLTQTELGTEIYANPPPDCPTSVPQEEWTKLTNIATRQLTYAMKASRLFLQVAKQVNTLDSRVLFSNAEVSALEDLRTLREGSQEFGIPAPVTQPVSDSYGAMFAEWVRLGGIMADNILTVSATDTRLLQIAEDNSKAFITLGLQALDAMVNECYRQRNAIMCEILKLSGRQRLFIQKSAFEAVLISLERNLEDNRQELIKTIQLFEETHYLLIHGNGANFPRATSVCILKEMKAVDDLWLPFKTLLMQVHGGDHSVSTLLTIWGMTWNAGVDPIFSQISAASTAFATGGGECTVEATQSELESGIKNVGMLREWTQKLSGYFFLIVKGLDTLDNSNKMVTLKGQFQTLLAQVISGYTPQTLPVPILQNVVDRLIEVASEWSSFSTKLDEPGSNKVQLVQGASLQILSAVENAMSAYVTAAWEEDKNVPGARSNMASSLLMQLQKMIKDAVLVGLGQGSSARNELASSIDLYKTSQQSLITGNAASGKDAIAALDPEAEENHITQMQRVTNAWTALEPKIKEIADGGIASDGVLREIVSKGDSVEAELLGALELYSTATVTTTKIAVDVLIPLPFTGRYTPGETMRTATMVAADIINEQQTVLPPEYNLKVAFLDSECDGDRAVTKVLGEFANSDEWTALGGMACSNVCEAMAVVVSSVFIPNLGYDCTDDALSDTTRFPGFVRLGVRTTLAKDVISLWTNMFHWDHIAIVSGNPILYRDEAQKFMDAFQLAGIESSYSSALESDWPGIVNIMRNANGAKRRIIMMMGDETFLRKLICAANEIDARPGLTWISVGANKKSWWTVDDPEVIAHSAACTGNVTSALFQGALSITGLGVPETKDKDKELSCFKGYTSESMLALIDKSLKEGYPAGSNIVTAPHETLMGVGADGICVLAKTLGHMLYNGYIIDQLRQYGQNGEVYKIMTKFIRDELQFTGVSGTIDFVGNDKPGRLGLFQVNGSESVPVGTVGVDGTIQTGYSYGLRNASWLPAYPDPPGKLDSQWKLGLITAGRQSLLSQKAALDLLLVSQALDIQASKQALIDDIATFEQEHQSLKGGSADGEIPEPTLDIINALEAVMDLWSPFKSFLQSNMNKASINATHLTTLNQMNLPLVAACEVLAGLYVDAGNAAGAQFSGLQVNTASRQGMLTQKMAVEALFVHAGVSSAIMLSRLEQTSRLFAEAHAGILEGLNFVGLSATVNKCILQQMRVVTFLWDKLKYVIDGIIFASAVSSANLNLLMEQTPNMLNQTEIAADIYASPPSSCPVDVSAYGWQIIIDISTRQLTYASKACRLFMQAAAQVNTLDSIVLFSNAEVSAQADLKLLREGSEELDVPAPVTEGVSTQYGSMFAEWLRLGAVLADNIDTVTASDDRQLQLVEDEGKAFVISGLKALEDVVTECKAMSTGVPCVVLQVAGRQRMLIQKAAFEALLIALGRSRDLNKEQLLNTSALFETSHYNLVHGNGTDIPRTTHIGTLQMMKNVDDLWLPYKTKLMQVYEGDYSVATLTDIWSQTWNAGVDPIFSGISAAMQQYATGTGTVTPTATRSELESAIKELGRLREWTQTMSTYFLLIVKGIDYEDNLNLLTAKMTEFQALLAHLISGYTPANLPVPVDQNLAHSLFELAGNWSAFEPKLAKGTLLVAQAAAEDDRRRLQEDEIDAVAMGNLDILGSTEVAMTAYVDAAYVVNPDVPGARSNLASKQQMLIQKMVKDSLLVSLGKEDKREEIASTIEEYKDAQQILTTGNSAQGKDAIAALDAEAEVEHVVQMQRVSNQWTVLEPQLQAIADGGEATDVVVTEVRTKGAQVETELTGATQLYSTMTQTTTKIPVDVLVPLPLTGGYTPGSTMRIATMVAMDLINQQQLILPGYRINVEFMDDQCDKEHAMREVLAKFASNDDWVALGGMGCSSVCESLAVISSSMWIPTVSMDCSADSLSDTTLYPDFVRLGIKTTMAADVIIHWAEMFKWQNVNVLSGDPTIYRDEAQAYIDALKVGGVSSSYSNAMEDDFNSIKSMMKSEEDNKNRIFLVIGNSSFFRKLVCATAINEARPGITWISVGVQQQDWWMADDPELMALDPTCTGAKITELFDGALRISGMGVPEEQHKAQTLSCFQGYTSETLLALISDSLESGYIGTGNATLIGNNSVTAPFVELMGAGADALCVVAKTIRYMIDEGHSITELRSPQQTVYQKEVLFIREQLDFTGVAGRVKFTGNDRPDRLGLYQINSGVIQTVGNVSVDGTITTSYELGLRNATWTEAFPDDEDPPFPVHYIIIPCVSLLICCPCCLAWYAVRREEILGRRGLSSGQGLFSMLFGSSSAATKTKTASNNGYGNGMGYDNDNVGA